MAEKTSSTHSEWARKVWIAGGILALIAVVLLLLQRTFNVWLLVLAGVLIAVFFRGLSHLICSKTRWKESVCLTVSILGTLVLFVLLIWIMGATVQSQADQLSKTLPGTIENAKNQLNQSAIGKKLVQKANDPQTQKQGQALLQTFFKSTFGILGDLYVVLFLGIFFTVSPRLYRDGIVQLVPPRGKEKAKDVLEKLGVSLKKWLKGQLFAMFVVFLLTAAALGIMGIPMWLVLALIAGLLNFIPNFGPIIAMIPAVLVALSQSTSAALWVAGIYIAIQVLESNFITPMVQKKMVHIPPAMIIMAQLFIAPFSGGWGLVLATPLMVILMVVVQELYVKRQEGREVGR